MKDGGKTAMRGLLVQTLIALLKALDEKQAWTSVTLEPNVDSEKVDILWNYPDRVKAVQVKSTQNAFSPRDIEHWAAELESWQQANEYELVLVGTPESPAAAKIRRVGKVAVPQAKPLDPTAFQEQAAHRLAKFLAKNGLAHSTNLLSWRSIHPVNSSRDHPSPRQVVDTPCGTVLVAALSPSDAYQDWRSGKPQI